MAKVVIAIYDDVAAAYEAMKGLIKQGFQRDRISFLMKDNRSVHEEAGVILGEITTIQVPGIGTVAGVGPITLDCLENEHNSIIETLMETGIPEQVAHSFGEGVRRGDALVSVNTEDGAAEEARELLDRHRPYDINQRSSQWRMEGWEEFDDQATPYPTEAQPRGQASGPGTNWSQDLSKGHAVTYSDFNTYEASFRNHFATAMIGSGYTYEQYQPAYRYGYNLAINQINNQRGWDDIEPEARQYWDQRNPGTWDHIKGAVRYAWEEIHASAR